ncbi:MAG: PPC domain-containing protein [Deltaproteobacteria bacterium]|nr:PPC domain-containing protein [Deltaproteobacteria bacterium]
MIRFTHLSFAALAAVSACTDEADLYEGEDVKADDGKFDSSAVATFVDATWQGTLVTDFSFNDRSTIQSQLFYTVGQLNGMNAVGRIDKAEITNIQKTTVNGKIQIKYTAKMLVAWGNRANVPASITLRSPRDVSSSGQTSFATKYGVKCVDFSAHDVDSGSMFYYYRPARSGCTIDAAELDTVTASFAPSPVQTSGKYPEYNKIWEDNQINVVAIFGKNKDGETSNDVGIDAYNRFVGAMKGELANRALTTVPANVSSTPGVGAPDIEFNATLPDGKKIKVVALLTDNIRLGLQQPAFRARYESLSTRADYIVYNGHAGLGTNVRAMAAAGKWVAGQYVVIQLNGCDTFAYIDDALNKAHMAVNPDDTTGYKYLDLVNNAMPAFFHELSNTSMAMFRGLIAHDQPKTFEQMFANIDRDQVVLVSGEQDNVFTPGGGGNPQPWPGLSGSGALARAATKLFATPVIAAGDYEFTITGNNDADLYVRVGQAPTTTAYDCRPYKTGSNESCKVTLAQPSTIHVMVRGYSTATSTFQLTGKKI